MPRISASANSHVRPRPPRRSGATNDWANSIPMATNPSACAVPSERSRPAYAPAATNTSATPTRDMTRPKTPLEVRVRGAEEA